MKKTDNKPLATVIGATFITSLSTAVVHAGENPFALKDLASGYMAEAGQEQAKPKKEAMCGAEVMKQNPEMKCGASMMKMEDMPQQPKATEGKCAGMKMDEAPQPSAAPKAE
jgi:hypothetical protein